MAENKRRSWDQSQLRKYNIQCEAIPRLQHDDPKVLELIMQNKPVVILKSDMVKSTEKWDLEYLEKNMGNSDFTVFQSRNHKFKFFDDKKAAQLLNNNKIECQPNMKRINIKLSEFCQRLKQWKRGDESIPVCIQEMYFTISIVKMRDEEIFMDSNIIYVLYRVKPCLLGLQKLLNESSFACPVKMTNKNAIDYMLNIIFGRLYLQQPLNNTVGPAIVDDFLHFKWDWITNIQKLCNWGPLTSNLLLISMEGNVTPCHYDEQQNLFAQISGFKRCLLFPPDQFECLYPHPVYHPHDRQSQVDFEKPDFKKFPKFSQLKGQEAVIGPGEVLYIPIYWWHHVESLMRGGYTFSINFWYKAGPTGPITYPLKDHQKVAIMRNVEKMVIDALGDPREVGPLFRALVLGRYTDESKSEEKN